MGNLPSPFSTSIVYFSDDYHYRKILKEIPNNAFQQLEYYLSQKNKPCHLKRSNNLDALQIRYFSYLSRAQESNIEDINPKTKYVYFFLHGSDMSGIIKNLPSNVCAISFNADGIKDIWNEDLLFMKNEAFSANESSTLVIYLMKLVLILLFIIPYLVMLHMLASHQDNQSIPTRKYAELTEEVYNNGKGLLKIEFDINNKAIVQQQLRYLGIVLNFNNDHYLDKKPKREETESKIQELAKPLKGTEIDPSAVSEITQPHDTELVEKNTIEEQYKTTDKQDELPVIEENSNNETEIQKVE